MHRLQSLVSHLNVPSSITIVASSQSSPLSLSLPSLTASSSSRPLSLSSIGVAATAAIATSDVPMDFLPPAAAAAANRPKVQRPPTQTRDAGLAPPLPKRTLEGKVAIVTGAGRGIGAGIVTHLARDGAKVVLNYATSHAAAQEVVKMVRAAGGTVEAVQADVTRADQVDFLFSEAKRLFGRIDIVVANAGIGVGRWKPFVKITEPEFDRVVHGNMKSAFLTLKAAAINVERDGRIIGVGSSTRRGFQGVPVYSATKAAMGIFCNVLAIELAPKNITVNCVHPGPVATVMMDEMPGSTEMLAKVSPFNRVGTANDIGAAIALLVSSDAQWISGQEILLSGGGKDY